MLQKAHTFTQRNKNFISIWKEKSTRTFFFDLLFLLCWNFPFQFEVDLGTHLTSKGTQEYKKNPNFVWRVYVWNTYLWMQIIGSENDAVVRGVVVSPCLISIDLFQPSTIAYCMSLLRKYNSTTPCIIVLAIKIDFRFEGFRTKVYCV